MRSEEQIKEILQRYIMGQASQQEIVLLEKWYESAAGGKRSDGFMSVSEEDRLVAALRRKMDETGLPRRNFLLRPSWRAAAVWIGLIVLSGWAVVQFSKHSRRSLSQQEASFIEVATSFEQVRKIKLPDSSVVWLNSATRLSYSRDFNRRREVRLTGEAFFEVKSDPGRPFTVRAGKTLTQVMGTAFNVSAYPSAGQLRVALKSGRVGVNYGSQTAKETKVLEPGQLMIYDKETGSGQIEQQQPGDMDAWTSGRLIFYKTPLKEAFAQIEARYGVHIGYKKSLNNQTITARFENTALVKVLQYLSFGWDLHFDQKKDSFYVR